MKLLSFTKGKETIKREQKQTCLVMPSVSFFGGVKKNKIHTTMAQTIDVIIIKDIKLIGSHNKMIHDTEIYPHTLKKLSKDVKKTT